MGMNKTDVAMLKTKNLGGTKLADEILGEVKKKVVTLTEVPHLAIIFVGENEPSKIFIRMKQNACKKTGIKNTLFKFNEGTKESEVLDLIKKLNEDAGVHGILVQLPIPNMDENKIFNSISPVKDVDGLTPKNIGNLLLGNEIIVPATVAAIAELLRSTNVDLKGKEVVIINRSNLIGKPLSMVLIKKSATVTLCHTKTKDIAKHTKQADIVITATGKPNFLVGRMIKKGSIVIDAGSARYKDKTCGDVNFNSVYKRTSLITPVPGGVGPLTVAFTIKNLLRCYELQHR
jgi:methylenetetrahydrofolate dehydrogenase (NADP+)/methenyltetrahydrofolate cyclohydrolase